MNAFHETFIFPPISPRSLWSFWYFFIKVKMSMETFFPNKKSCSNRWITFSMTWRWKILYNFTQSSLLKSDSISFLIARKGKLVESLCVMIHLPSQTPCDEKLQTGKFFHKKRLRDIFHADKKFTGEILNINLQNSLKIKAKPKSCNSLNWMSKIIIVTIASMELKQAHCLSISYMK